MVSSGQKKIVAYGLIALVLASAGLTVASIMGYRNPVGDLIAEGLGFDLGGEEKLTGKEYRVSADVFKKGVESTYPSATVLIWRDWDGDSMVDLGSRPALEGEIETLASSDSNGFTSGEYYPEGATIYIQVSATGYETQVFAKEVKGVPDANNIVYIGGLPLMLLETSITVTISEADAGTLTTGTGDYNYTLYGTDAALTVRIACATDDAGIFVDDYTNWVSGKSYKGTFIGMTFDVEDGSNMVFNSAYDGYKQVGSYIFVWWDLSSQIFNDAGVSEDGTFDLDLSVTLVGDVDINTIGIYDTMLMQNFDQCAWGTADGSETDIDFVAGI